MSTPALYRNEPVELTISLTPDQYETLLYLSQRQGLDVNDALAQAIDIARIVVDADTSKDERVLIQRGKDLQELTLK